MYFKDSYKEMMKLKEKGLQMLVVFGSFAKVSIKYRIDEIKLLCNDFETKLEARRELLQVSLDVFTCLDQVNKNNLQLINESKYSTMDQEKIVDVEGSLEIVLLGPFLNTLSQLVIT